MSEKSNTTWIKEDAETRIGMTAEGQLVLAAKDGTWWTMDVDNTIKLLAEVLDLRRDNEFLKRENAYREPNRFLKQAIAEIRKNTQAHDGSMMGRGIALGNLEAVSVLQKFLPDQA